MEEKTVHIPSISCGHCIMTVKKEVSELEGITSVEGDVGTKMVTIKWDNPTTWEKIALTLEEVGYPAKQ
jgi:copper chaperone CopZ